MLLIWGSWAHFLRSFDLGAPLWSRDSTIDIGLPIWPAKLVVPVAFGVLALRLAIQTWGYGRALVRVAEAPVAVPLVQSAAEIAAGEAEALTEPDATSEPGGRAGLSRGRARHRDRRHGGACSLLVVLGMRVAFAAALAGLVGLVWIFWSRKDYALGELGWALGVAVQTAGQVPHSKISTQALSLIPTFILIGYLAYHAGLTTALFEAAKRWVGWLPGGLAVSTVFATAGFAAVSGASVATAAVFARIAIPEMLASGYDRRFAAGVVAAGGTLASLIPPSAILVIYAIIVEQDVGRLLLAGFLPGMFSAVVYAGLIVGLALAWKGLGPPVGGFGWRSRLASLPPALPILAVVLIIILFVYNPFGEAFGTPTEGGALGAAVVLAMALWRGMGWRQLRSALLETREALGDDLHDHLGRADLRPLPRLRRPAGRVRGLDLGARPAAADDAGDDPAGLRRARHVHGRDRDAAADAARGLPAVMALNGGLGVSAEDSAFGMSGPLCAVWFGILVVKMAEFCLITPPIGLNCFVVAGGARGPVRGRRVPRGDALLHRRRDHHRAADRVSVDRPLASLPK